MKINKVYDANVYVNDASTHGTASEVTLPDVSAVMTEYKSLGMIGTAEFFNGFQKMEASIKWTYPDNDAKIACADPRTPVELMVRSNKSEMDSTGITADKPILVIMRGTPNTHPGGTFKSKEDVELESKFSITYYKEEIDGEPIIELDVMNNIYKINGDDVMSTFRANLGI